VQLLQIARGSHTCWLGGGGSLRCSGYNFYGGLGDGTTMQRTTPVASFSFSGTTAVGAGAGFTCALDSGFVRCWGANGSYECADAVTGPTRLSPNAVPVGVPVVAISTGSNHACARTMMGGLVCWGSNFFSQLGDGTAIDRAVPVEPFIQKLDIVDVSAGMDHTCARLVAGPVRCWGGAAEGQIGDGMTGVQRFTPVDVLGLAGPVKQIVAGARRTCALLQDRRVQCWGSNVGGALGDGTTTNRPSPTFVVGL
jgi:alpha-tubulin suppressor-like RCC1 family protein